MWFLTSCSKHCMKMEPDGNHCSRRETTGMMVTALKHVGTTA